MRSLTRYFPLGMLAVALLVAAPARAQYGAIEGIVKDSQGKPVAGAKIVIDRLDIKGHFEVKTDKKGFFYYMGLPAGTNTRYKVAAYQGEALLYTWESVGIPMGETVRVDFDMAKLRQETMAQMTEEQKRQQEEMKKAEEQGKQLQELFERGRTALQTKQFQEAISSLEAAAAIDATQSAVWLYLGQAYVGIGQTDKSIEAFEKSLALKPENGPVHGLLAMQYARKGRAEEARQAADKAATLDPRQAGTYYFNLGATLVNQGEMKAALDPLKKSIELEPSRAEAYYWLGVCLYANAESKIEGGVVKTVLQPGTVEAFEKYLELEPNGPYANDAKQALAVIEAQVPASMNVKKKR